MLDLRNLISLCGLGVSERSTDSGSSSESKGLVALVALACLGSLNVLVALVGLGRRRGSGTSMFTSSPQVRSPSQIVAHQTRIQPHGDVARAQKP